MANHFIQGIKSLFRGNKENGKNGRNGASGSSQETPNDASTENPISVANERLTRRSRIPDVVPLPSTSEQNGACVPVVVPKKEPDWEPEDEIIERDPRMQRRIGTAPPDPPPEPPPEPQPVEIPLADMIIKDEVEIETENNTSTLPYDPNWMDQHLTDAESSASSESPEIPQFRFEEEPLDDDHPSPSAARPADDDGNSSGTEGLPSPMPAENEEDQSSNVQEPEAQQEIEAPVVKIKKEPGASQSPSPTNFYSKPMDLDDEEFEEDGDDSDATMERSEPSRSPIYSQVDDNRSEEEEEEEEDEEEQQQQLSSRVHDVPAIQNVATGETEFDSSDESGDECLAFPPSPSAEQEEEEEALENSQTGQKRSLPEASEELNLNQPAKKSKFHIDKGNEPVREQVEPVASGSKSNRLPAKVTSIPRGAMMVADMVKAREANPPRPIAGRRSTTAVNKRKRQPSGDTDAAAGIELPQLDLALVPAAAAAANRDPRTRRPAPPPAPETPPPPIPLSVAIKMSMLKRILRWHFNWIGEQVEQGGFSKPPPLFESKDDGSQPDLKCVLLKWYMNSDSTESLDSYFEIFHPLMLHELWASICQQNLYRKKPVRWKKVLIKTTTEDPEDPDFCLLHCSVVMNFEQEAPKLDDLVTFTFHRSKGEAVPVFGHIHSSHSFKVRSLDKLDDRIRPDGRPGAAADFIVRIRKNYSPGRKPNAIFEMPLVASLSSFLDQIRAQTFLGEALNTFVDEVLNNPNRTAAEIKIALPMMKLVLIPRKPAFDLVQCGERDGGSLDPFQTEAKDSIAQTVRNAPGEPRFILLNAPPGTGKTKVMLHMINYLMSIRVGNNRPDRLLYCAPTDAAVDEAVRQLLIFREKLSETRRFNVIRFGRGGKDIANVREVTVEALSKRWLIKQESEAPSDSRILDWERKRQELQERRAKVQEQLVSGEADQEGPGKVLELEAENDVLEEGITAAEDMLETLVKEKAEDEVQKFRNARLRIILDADVICLKIDDCFHPDLETIFIKPFTELNGKPVTQRPFLCGIIDDASQCTEPQSLFPLTLGIRKLVLVGDIEQQPMSLISPISKEYKLTQSLFSRLYTFCEQTAQTSKDWQNPVFKLTEQFRMDERICRWPSKYYYGGKLTTCNSVYYEDKTPLHAYRVFDIRDGQETKVGRDTTNEREAKFVVKLVEGIFANGALVNKSIGIITFFRKQKKNLKITIREKFPDDYKRIKIGLPEKFTGAERDIIIISFVKANNPLTKNYRPNLSVITDKLNVAVTRATQSLYLCGHLPTLMGPYQDEEEKACEVLRDLIKDADTRQVIHRVSSLFHPSLVHDLILKPANFCNPSMEPYPDVKRI